MERVNPLRHLSVFNPNAFGKRRVDVIGVGATGSRIALSLAKLGISNLVLWDHDVVEKHNIANQAFSFADVGKPKVEAMRGIILAQTGLECTAMKTKVDADTPPPSGDVIFLLTDSMESRREIWQGCIKMKLNVKLMVETRMSADSGRVYALNPCSLSQIRAWEDTLKGKIVETSSCGTSISVGPTADVLAGIAVWQFIKWFNLTQGDDGELENEILYSLRPAILTRRLFKS